jgi:pilus assembly protein CpaE
LAASAILLLETDEAAAERITEILIGVGYRLTTTRDADEAIKLVATHQLVVLDHVEGSSVVETVCREIRATPAIAPVPILCLTEGNDVDGRVRLLEAGADDVMTRPFDTRELEARVEALLVRLQRSSGRAPLSSAAPVTPSRPHQVLACFSPKGGVGTTTIAVNVAVTLAEREPGKVALVDLAIPIGLVSTHLDIRPRFALADIAHDPQVLADPSLLRSAAERYRGTLDVFCLPARPDDADRISPEQVAALLESIGSAYPFVVVDGGSALGPRSIVLLERADRLVIATCAEIGSLKAVAAFMGVLADHEIANRATFVVNHLFAREMVRPADISGTLGARIAVELPYDPLVYVKAVNEGIPVVRGAPRSAPAAELARLADIIVGEAETEESTPAAARRGRLGGLLRRT